MYVEDTTDVTHSGLSAPHSGLSAPVSMHRDLPPAPLHFSAWICCFWLHRSQNATEISILVMSTASSWTWRVRFPSADVGVPLFTDLATEKQDSLDAQRETWPWSAWASANLLLSITALNQQDMYKELMCKQKSTDTYTVVSYRLSSSNPQVKAKNRFLRAAFSRFNRGEVNFFFW